MLKKVVAIAIVVFLVIGMLASFVFGESLTTPSKTSVIVYDEQSCKNFAKKYIDGNSFDELYGYFDEVKAMRMPKEYFSNQLKNLEHITGKFQSFGDYREINNKESKTYVLALNMEKKQVIMMLTMAPPYRERKNREIYSTIHTLQFAIADTQPKISINGRNSIAVEEKAYEYQEKDIDIPSEKNSLRGKLTIVNSEKKLPAVLLIQSDSPFDMDYTNNNTAIFKDISHYLAQNGIISLRYNNRAFEQKDLLTSGKYTPNDTVIDDAVNAINILQSDDRVDKERIYIIAHSYSTYYVPQILKNIKGNIAGLIYLSSSPLSMLDLYNVNTANAFSNLSEEKLLDAINKNLSDFEVSSRIKDMSDEDLDKTMIFNRSAYYFKSQMDYNNDEILSEKALPMLILHAMNDNVIDKEYGIELWDQKFSGVSSVIRKIYSGLDHYLVNENENHINQDVLDDIVTWILQTKGE